MLDVPGCPMPRASGPDPFTIGCKILLRFLGRPALISNKYAYYWLY
jgi:hypothetical protein